MDLNLLEQMIKLMSANDLNTVDVRDGDKRVILRRGAQMSMPMAMPSYAPAPVPSTPAVPAAASSSASSSAGSPPAEDANLIPIKSPMVGTFYAAPAKGAKPFVTVGSTVDEETDVCIVEAMKVFNNIKAECRGTIARILIQDSQPVEFGQVLFLVKPT